MYTHTFKNTNTHIPLKTYSEKFSNTWIEESKTLKHKHTKIDFGNQIEANLQRTCLQKKDIN
jgi:outer membrane protease